jgi:hypothetical protein
MFTGRARLGPALGLAAALSGAAIALVQAQQELAAPAGSPSPALARIRVLCVESIAGDQAGAAAVREIVIAGLFAAKRFVVTEKCDKADAVLKGALTERSSTRVRAEGESADFGVAAGAARVTGSTGAAAIGAAAGGSAETLYSQETRSHAALTLRLVDPDGLVIWAHTQESPGGKLKGPVADAVERSVRQLVKDYERSASR